MPASIAEKSPFASDFQKKRGVHKISARNSGAGNGCANFMGAWHFWFVLLENPHAHKIPPFRGGFWVFLEGGVEVPILFLWAQGFFRDFGSLGIAHLGA